jgi:AcrR family transcriptional regulator
MDSRIVQTKQALRNAMRELVRRQAPGAISVTDLCAKAHVGRATFYRHYSIPLDVYNEMVKDRFNEDAAIINTTKPDISKSALYSLVLKECRVYYAEKEQALESLKRDAGNEIKFVNQYFGKTPETWVNYFRAAGCTAVLKYCLLHKPTVPVESCARMLTDAIWALHGLK